MALIKTKKIQIIALKEKESELLSFLQNSEIFSNENFDENSEKNAEKKSEKIFKNVLKNKSDLAFAISFLSPFNENKKEFKYKLLGEKEISSIEKVKKTVESFDFGEIIEKCNKSESEITILKNRKTEIKKELKLINNFKNIKCDTCISGKLKGYKVFIGESKKIDYSLLKEEIETKNKLIHFLEIEENKNTVSFLLIYSKEISKSIKEELSKFSVLEFKDFKKYKNILHTYEQLNLETKKIDSKIETIEEGLKKLSSNLKELKECHDYFLWQNNKKEVSENSFFTEKTISIYGWVREDKFDFIKNSIEKITKSAFEINELKLEENEKAPIELENNAIVKPLETVTKLYGLPGEKEIDPTPYLMPFFLIFFGFCITDAIYGTILLTFSLLALKFMYVPKESQPGIKLLGYMGFSTIIMGILFGGYGGLQEYGLIPDFLMQLKIFDMGGDKLNYVMILAFSLGFIQVMVGSILKGIINIKNGKKTSAILMNFSRIPFFAIILAVEYFNYPDLIIWITVGIMAIFQAHESKGVVGKIIGLLLSLVNEIIAIFSSVLSYARLFALGISTGIISTVFNSVAMDVGSSLPLILKIIVMGIIILFGHILNIALNTLGGFIHSSRLQFVEFFGRFIDGGGKAFKPMKKESVHIYLEK